eukprot:TRINITY_DN35387_c0_g1_i1.p1 TRINITY_DN35387_c0_g1~~TRINITY_DN35387_c0_g1_i1.p1  ORF type:complete len:326 (+),score=39.25 TRINITY_DN35387_c0_g1_i1:130-978(+)
MIVGMYLEYLWAADWQAIPEHCESRSSLPWLDFCDCYHRYTFSHAMLRGQNLTVFGCIGTGVALCFLVVEHQRVQRLRLLLRARVEGMGADSSDAASSGAKYALRCLPVYSFLMTVAFLGVLLLVPFHLERPRLHYLCAASVAGCMLVGVCIYATMPLQQAAGWSGTGPEAAMIVRDSSADGGTSDELLKWAQRHQLYRKIACFVVAWHIILPATTAIHHFAWIDATGRLFGACEVLTILSYQIFVAFFAIDDFAVREVNHHKPQIVNSAKDAQVTDACAGG